MAIEVRWRINRWATALHAAEAVGSQRREVAPPLADAIREPVLALQREIEEAGLPEERFWGQLVPLGAETENGRQLSELVLRKTLGQGRFSEAVVASLARALLRLDGAVGRHLPELLATLTSQSEPLRQQWLACGPNLLHRAALLTDGRAVVGAATVDLVYAALGGGGVAHLDYNSVRIEVLEQESEPELPEVVRLAWLVAQLNVDLPLFGETIPRSHLGRVAAHAMLPAVLHAAGEVDLVRADSTLLQRAVERWQPQEKAAPQVAEVLTSWWESYLEMRPSWAAALGALDAMLHSAAM